MAGECRTVINYAAGCGRLRRAEPRHFLDGALARLIAHGWVVRWRIVPRTLNGEAHALAADGRAGRPCWL
eukprot:12995464-Alexandrium_andersonii.AAC.1